MAAALAVLAAQPGARPLAGGVGILRRARLGEPVAEAYVDLGGLAALREIRVTRRGVVVGALATLAEVAASGAVARAAPLLAEACAACASPGIRSMATLGGNLVDEPALSDPAAALLALAAEAIVHPPATGRRVALESLIATGPGWPAGELLGAVVIEGGAGGGWGFERLPVRGAADASAATVAVRLDVSAGVVATARAWATGIGQRPLRLAGLETALTGVRLEEAATRRLDGVLGQAADDDLAPAALRDEPRASAWYRRTVVAELTLRATATAARRVAGR